MERLDTEIDRRLHRQDGSDRRGKTGRHTDGPLFGWQRQPNGSQTMYMVCRRSCDHAIHAIACHGTQDIELINVVLEVLKDTLKPDEAVEVAHARTHARTHARSLARTLARSLACSLRTYNSLLD